MAKTLEKIAARGEPDEFDGVSRKLLIVKLRVARGELARTSEKLVEAEVEKGRNWEVASDWKTRCKTFEAKSEGLERAVEKLAGQLNRCMGFIAAKLEEHPAEESKPDNPMKLNRDFEYANRARMMTGEPMEQRRKTWREYLGLDQ